MLYRFTLVSPEIVYADTIGTTWNTVLFVTDAAGTPISDPGIPTYGKACSDDDGLMGCSDVGKQSQILLRLGASSYYLVVSGCADGVATVHFHHLPVGNGPVAFLPAGTDASVAGTTSGGGIVNGTCCSGGPENTYVWLGCPAYPGGAFSASTCGGATWDTNLEQRSAARATVAVCNDDLCNAQSTVTSAIPGGAGLHTLTVDGCGGTALGPYVVTYTRP